MQHSAKQKMGEYVRHKGPIVAFMTVKHFHFCISEAEKTTSSPIKFTPIENSEMGKPESKYAGLVVHTVFLRKAID